MNNTIGFNSNIDITVTKANLFVLVDALHKMKESLPNNYLCGPLYIEQLIDYLEEKKATFNVTYQDFLIKD
jgi:hypothetical protein